MPALSSRRANDEERFSVERKRLPCHRAIFLVAQTSTSQKPRNSMWCWSQHLILLDKRADFGYIIGVRIQTTSIGWRSNDNK